MHHLRVRVHHLRALRLPLRSLRGYRKEGIAAVIYKLHSTPSLSPLLSYAALGISAT
jgi:hypothetical protein